MWTRHKEFASGIARDVVLDRELLERAQAEMQEAIRQATLREVRAAENKIAALAAARAGCAVAEDGHALMLTPAQLARIMQACATGKLTVQWGPRGPMSVSFD